MNKMILIIGLILIAFIIFFTGYNLKTNRSLSAPLVTIEPTIQSTITVSKYDLKYMDGCLEGGKASRKYCECTWDYLIERYTDKKITEITLNYMKDDKNIPVEMMDAAKTCVKYY